MEKKLRFRCPQCIKLYEVEPQDIKSYSPHFECKLCRSVFTFDFPPANPDEIKTRFVVNAISTQETSQEGSLSTASGIGMGHNLGSKSCPKCGAINVSKSRECYSCRVLFDKLVDLPKDKSLGAQPSLVRKWKELLENFESAPLHEDFIRNCRKLGGLKYALHQYQELLQVTGGDSYCQKQIEALNREFKNQSKPQQQASTFLPWLERAIQPFKKGPLEWRRLLWCSPFVTSASLILFGYTHAGSRNLVGAGVALAFLALGLLLIFKGKISITG